MRQKMQNNTTTKPMADKQTAVEWLAEKYNYVTWLRNRDEISAGMADEWRKHYLEIAKQMEKHQIMQAWIDGMKSVSIAPFEDEFYNDEAERYYEKFTALRQPSVVGRSEQLLCPKCKSENIIESFPHHNRYTCFDCKTEGAK